jgi:uncharacterized protein YndB with AHSA1/START domain
MTQTATPRQLKQHIRLKAPVERVYAALIQADLLAKWFPTKVTTDPRVGGALHFEFHRGGEAYLVDGKFLELVPNQLVRYSWHSQLDDEGQSLTNLTVTFRLEAVGDETELFLDETGYGTGAAYDELFGSRTDGWTFFTNSLAAMLAGGPDPRAAGAPCGE